MWRLYVVAGLVYLVVGLGCAKLLDLLIGRQNAIFNTQIGIFVGGVVAVPIALYAIVLYAHLMDK